MKAQSKEFIIDSRTKESVKVLLECIELQTKKGEDYQADVSNIKQADYYRRGVESIYDIMHAKMLRIQSLMDKAKAGHDSNFESLEDSFKDLINYASFGVSYLRRSMDGQKPNHDMFNRELSYELTEDMEMVDNG